ncbi:FAD-dependent monooxygenase [Actinophytocola sp.]|uniref:FAD-dependent monooxygenase n=1 Tax=Actinophytocola sp. TaxID=1872138 RepID=UPI0025C72B28|nr:FAD-dependent monooxygenase [Actinophytocola sp.]
MESVMIVGGGPVGLFLAAELALAGVTPLVVERLTEPDPRKGEDDRGITARTMRTLAARGLADATTALAEAAVRRLARLADPSLVDTPKDLPALLESLGMADVKGDFAMLPLVDRNGTMTDLSPPLMVLQGEFEEILACRVAELGVPVRRGVEVTAVAPGDDRVTVTLADGSEIETAWLVGCDGGRSTVRRCVGFDFPGTDPSMVARIAVADIDLAHGFQRLPTGMLAVAPPPAPSMTIEFDPDPTRDGELTAAEFEASLRRVSGTGVTVREIAAPTRITDNARQTSTYRRGRVLLAGDAAHVHSPIGGQGLNLGLQDAANLGWKLGLVAGGRAPESLLDTYTRERHPVGAEVLRNSRAETALLRTDPQIEALRALLAELPTQRHLVELMNGLHIRYEPGEHPLTGTFVDDPHALELLRAGRGLLLGGHLHETAAAWADRITTAGGEDGVLVRPDGYIAWAGTDPDGLRAALIRWFGP